jgi:hypothetical protein
MGGWRTLYIRTGPGGKSRSLRSRLNHAAAELELHLPRPSPIRPLKCQRPNVSNKGIRS